VPIGHCRSKVEQLADAAGPPPTHERRRARATIGTVCESMETMSKHRTSVGVMEINQKDAINARKSAYCEALLAAGNTLLHNEPANVNDARQKPDWQKWKAAMQEELESLEWHGTYE